ncbi:alpha-ketoglutarate-dependent dioxygenase alkB homolog 7, mitochondrial isoform X1 [Danio rerio]|uniref:Alpha-ketoglutarate-dependent dioxygenase alkB homolog 7, mitochondrial isoform X1 n=1 Tax=Danio rerio TaxID=7955 RepID=A0AC58IQT6_DANRE
MDIPYCIPNLHHYFPPTQAIHGYRETERLQWGAASENILRRVRTVAFPEGSPLLGPVHVLDLDKKGYIKPHIDSVKFCGSTIAGLSLLSDSIMRLVPENNTTDRVDLLLSRRSLYILRDDARFKFTHEILKDEESFFSGQKVPRHRRISVICRNLPM